MVDSLITLFGPNETEFTSGGLGNLADASRCEAFEERNGEYELILEYPIFGRHYSEITYRSIIFAKPNPIDEHQPFRVYDISKPLNGIVTFNARHIRYDLAGYPISPFTAKNISGVFTELKNQMNKPWNSKKPAFQFTLDRKDSTGSEFSLLTPCSALSLLGGSEGSILDRFHGEYEWDKWNCILHESRGEDRGVTIAYGKNLTDLQQDENCENVWTGVYPYWFSEEDGLVELSTNDNNKIVYCEGTYDHERIYILDLSSEFQEKPTAQQLKDYTVQYIKDNELGSPKVSLEVSFLQLSDTVNYADIEFLETIKLCDTIHVSFPKMGVSSTAKCISTTYNCLTGKYISIELGDPKSDLTSTIAGQGSAINDRATLTYLEDTMTYRTKLINENIEHQTQLITGNKGGYLVIHDSDGDGKPDEALFMDTMDIATAKKVLRINKQGIGFSSKGYNGPYDTAWTLDGVFNADFITTGTMAADRILGGILKIGGSAYGNGSIRLYNASNKEIGYLDQTGIHFGNGMFDINADGNANFAGNVYAKNIQVGVSGGVDRGYVSSGQLGNGSVTSGKIANSAVDSDKLSGGSVTSSKIANGSVGYAKTSFTGTLDQVGVNKSNIETIKGYFTGSAKFSNLQTTVFWLNGNQVVRNTLTINGLQYRVLTWS